MLMFFFTKGYKRTLAYDVLDGSCRFITNDFYETICMFSKYTIGDVIKLNPYDVDVLSIIDYLLNKNLANLVVDLKPFVQIRRNWYSYCTIENALIDIDENSNHDYMKISNELQALLCKDIQIRSYTTLSDAQICYILDCFWGKDFHSIEFITKYNDKIKAKDYLLWAKSHPSVSFIIHSSPQNLFYKSLLDGVYVGVGYVQYIKQNITSADCCGFVNPKTFVHPRTVADYMEGIKRNRCLNMKISIDTNGNIKNCPAMKISYGNIKDKSLLDVCKNKIFKSYWFIKKDKIKVCKDCEYRYLCNDCRAFLKHKYDKPAKCIYSPYA